MNKITLISALFIIAAIGVGLYLWKKYRVPPTIVFENTMVKDLEGKQVNLDDLISGPTVIHFYASWCGPCMRELRDMAAVVSTTDLDKLNYIFITDDEVEKIVKIKGTVPAQIKFYQIASLQDLKIFTIPTTYFIDSNKKIIKEQVNPCDWGNIQFQSEIIQLIK